MKVGTLSKLIEKNFKYDEEERRDYIGASGIGSDCLRQIWYDYTCAKAMPLPLKLRRTFEIGKILEGFVIDILRKSGMLIETADESPTRHKFVDPQYPFFQGSCDAIILKPRRILEVKTAKDASFSVFVKNGLKKWNHKYYCQLQSYMGMSHITEAYIIVLNKDNSEIWDEYVEFDEEVYFGLRAKASLIEGAVSPPPRINGSPLWYQCKTCKFREVCHG